MNESKSQASGGGGAAALEARMERIRQSMSEQQARLARGSMLTASIGAVLCVLMAVWFSIGYGMLRDMTTPKKIVEAAEAVVLESLPEARKALEAQINDSADEWAAKISEEVQKNIPKVRVKLEDFIMVKADEALDHVQVVTAEQFRTFVTGNTAMLQDGFRSLKKPDDADQFVQDLKGALEQEMGRNMREQSEEMLHMVYDLNSKLEKLKSGKNLNAEQALELEILMIAKRLQDDSLDDRPNKPIKSARVPRSQDEPDADAPVAKADDASKSKEEKKADDKEPKAEDPKKSGDKSTDGDKPAQETNEKEGKGEKSDVKESKSGDN
jgi:hypothetical protein